MKTKPKKEIKIFGQRIGDKNNLFTQACPNPHADVEYGRDCVVTYKHMDYMLFQVPE